MPGRPILSNDRDHWRVKAKRVARLRADAAMLVNPHLLGGPFTRPVIVHARANMPRRGRPIDADAIAPAVKAVVDGFCDAGLLIDDGPRQVYEYRYRCPLRSESWSITVGIVETDGVE